MKRPDGQPYYTLGGDLKVTRKEADFCRRRVGGLLQWVEVANQPLADLLGNAYALGRADAAEH